MTEVDERRYKETFDKILDLDRLPSHQEVLDLIQFSEEDWWHNEGRENFRLFGTEHLMARHYLFPVGLLGGFGSNIYHLFTGEFVDSLASHIKGSGISGPAVEIAAGDGKLSYQLRRKGLDIIATDDYSMDFHVIQKLMLKD